MSYVIFKCVSMWKLPNLYINELDKVRQFLFLLLCYLLFNLLWNLFQIDSWSSMVSTQISCQVMEKYCAVFWKLTLQDQKSWKISNSLVSSFLVLPNIDSTLPNIFAIKGQKKLWHKTFVLHDWICKIYLEKTVKIRTRTNQNNVADQIYLQKFPNSFQNVNVRKILVRVYKDTKGHIFLKHALVYFAKLLAALRDSTQ